MNRVNRWLASLPLAGITITAHAQTIYPLNWAEILAGAKFDFKVEFTGAPAQANVRVTVNGRDAASVFGGEPRFVQSEDGQDISALWVRDAVVTAPGTYTVEASSGGKTAKVAWEVFGTQDRAAKNVILFIGDGMTIAHRTAARMLSKGIVEGRYGGELAIDDMPYMALLSTAGTDSIVTDSANSMSAYTTGHKSCVNALAVYCARNKNTLDHPKVETISELVKRKGQMAVGVVTNTEIEDATPAAMVAHTRRRTDYNDIVKMFFAVQPEVIMGGGSPNFLAKSTNGSRRTDDDDYIKKFQDAGYRFVTTAAEMKAADADASTTRLLGLFNTSNIDGALDRRLLKKGGVGRFPDQPDLADQVKVAIDLLSKNPNGFVLMVEFGRIDKYSHSMDPERAIFDTIMLDEAVKVAKEFAGRNNDTLVIVTPDHAHPVSIIGTYDDDAPGQTRREKLGIYEKAKFPKGPACGRQRLPQHGRRASADRFHLRQLSRPLRECQAASRRRECPGGGGCREGQLCCQSRSTCDLPGAVRVTGNLPLDAPQAVHSGDDVVVTAMGPGSEMFHGRMDNTKVFRIMVTALGLARQ